MLLAAAPHAARAADDIARNTAANSSLAGYPGQSIKTPMDKSYNNIVFNFYSAFSNATANTPTAAGTLFLLTQEYTGMPGGLNTNTTGYVAQATGDGSVYTFSSAVTLNANTQYFFYANVNQTIVTSTTNVYDGGTFYRTTGPRSPYVPNAASDAAFLLQGTVVPAAGATPEPGTLPLLGMGLVTGAGMVGGVRRRKAKNQTDHKATGLPA